MVLTIIIVIVWLLLCASYWCVFFQELYFQTSDYARQYVAKPNTLIYLGLELSVTRRKLIRHHIPLTSFESYLPYNSVRQLGTGNVRDSHPSKSCLTNGRWALIRSNARKGLHEKLNETIELKFPSNMFFGEPESLSDTVSLIGSNPYSPGQETKYADSDISSISGMYPHFLF